PPKQQRRKQRTFFHFTTDGDFLSDVCVSVYVCVCVCTRAAAEDPGLKREALDVLDAAAHLGLSAVRAWAFGDGEHWNALQPTAGQFDERVFKGLDFVIAQAKARGLQLILVLTDYFPPYGGLQQYVRWSRGLRKEDPVCAEYFYTDTRCHAMFERFCCAVLLRVNTYTGVMYRDDPTILAWEICNEPRCKHSSGVPSEAMHQAWTSKAAAHIHRLDPNHLVTTGNEGFFGPTSPGRLCD
ncbi:glycoside hydrolase superfamily, partial [Dunaliella salina]